MDINKIKENIDKYSEKELEELLQKYKIEYKTKEKRIQDYEKYLKKEYIPYPKKTDEKFFEKIYKKKEFFENKYPIIKDSEDIQKDICSTEEKNFKLLSHQIIIRNYMNYNTPYNSILLFHGMGSGKTLTSITVAETYRMNLGELNRTKIFVLVSGDTIEENFRKEIHDIKKGYNQGTFTNYMNYLPTDSNEIKQKKVDELINKYYEIEHYQKLSNIITKKKKELNEKDFKDWIKKTYSNRIFIIDEVHNLKLIKEDENIIKRYDAVKLILKNSINIKLLLLSGTPMGHSVKEIIDIMNLLLINDKKPEIKFNDIFKKNLDFQEDGEKKLYELSKSYISYITKENPYTFPIKKYNEKSIPISNFIENKFNTKFENIYNIEKEYKIIPCMMEKEQKENYLKALEIKKINVQDLMQLQLLNYDYVKDKKDKIIYNITFDEFKETNLKKLSSKFYELLQNIKKSKGPIFIYTNYVEKGILMIGSMLLKNGVTLFNSRGRDSKNELLISSMSKFKSKRFNPLKKNQLCSICNEKHNEKIKYDHDFKIMFFDYIIGQTYDDIQKKIINTFNDPENYNGSKLKIIIGSSVLKEGVSFLRIRQLNVMEPWHNKSRLDQVIARGIRHCSHKSLNKEDRNVEINLYCSILNNKYDYKISEKEEIYKKIKEISNIEQENEKIKVEIELAKKFKEKEPLFSYDVLMYKRIEISEFYISKVQDILKSNAFDCTLNKNLNKINDDYKCNGISENFNYNLSEEEIDDSTYLNIFLTPYIKYVISFILKYMRNNLIITLDILKKNKYFQSNIYKEKDYYIFKKALNIMLPIEENLKTFPYIIEHININKKIEYGYLIQRELEGENIYLFKSFDNNRLYKKSLFEQTPIYNDYIKIEKKEKNLKNFLKILERDDKKNKDIKIKKIDYIDIITDQKYKSENKKNIKASGSEANNIIKENFPKDLEEKIGDYIGIKINRNNYKNRLWIRTKNKVGRDIISAFSKIDLNNLILTLWEKITDEKFKEKNIKEYTNIQKKSFKKEKLSKFIEKILNNLNENNVENKIWLYEIS